MHANSWCFSDSRRTWYPYLVCTWAHTKRLVCLWLRIPFQVCFFLGWFIFNRCWLVKEHNQQKFLHASLAIFLSYITWKVLRSTSLSHRASKEQPKQVNSHYISSNKQGSTAWYPPRTSSALKSLFHKTKCDFLFLLTTEILHLQIIHATITWMHEWGTHLSEGKTSKFPWK